MNANANLAMDRFTVGVGGAMLAGERCGDGRALLFLHAGVADRRMWLGQMVDLCDGYLTAAYDRRGFGDTITADEPFSHVEDLRAVFADLGIDSASLVGCSQGGRLAIDFALAYSDLVDQLVLIAPAISGAPPPGGFPPEAEMLFKELDEADDDDDLARINEIEANLWLDGPSSPRGRVGGDLRDLFLDMNGIALQMPEFEQEIEAASAWERAAALSLQVLVMWGDLDFPHVKANCRYLVQNIQGAEGIEFVGTAHLPNLEQPDKVNALLRSFLT